MPLPIVPAPSTPTVLIVSADMNPPEMMREADERKQSQGLKEAPAPLFGKRGVDDLADDLAGTNFGIREHQNSGLLADLPDHAADSILTKAILQNRRHAAIVTQPHLRSRVLGIEIGGRFAIDRFRTLEFVGTKRLLARRWRVRPLVECSQAQGRGPGVLSRAGDRIVSRLAQSANQSLPRPIVIRHSNPNHERRPGP